MAPPVNKQVVVKVLQVTKTTAIVGVAVSLVMKVFQPVKRWRLRKIPGPAFKPVVGDALQILRTGDATEFLDGLCVKFSHQTLFKYWICSTPYVVVRDPKLGKELMKNINTRPGTQAVAWAPGFERCPWENILIFINGDRWARCRRAMEESVMHASALNAHAPSLQACIDRLLVMLDKSAATGKPINVKDCCSAMAQDAIGHAILNLDLHCDGLVDSQAGADAVLQSAMAALAVGAKANSSPLTPDQIEDGWWDKYPVGSPEFGKRFVSCSVNLISMLWTQMPVVQLLRFAAPGLTPLWRLLGRILPDKRARTQLKMMRGLRSSCQKLIQHWKAENVTGLGDGKRQQGLMYSMLSESAKEGGAKVGDDEVMSAVFSAVVAGYDTTANSFAVVLHYLSRNPDVQRMAQQEVDRVLGSKALDPKDVKNLPYVSAVISEALRLSAPASVNSRRTESEYVHPGDVFRIPAGTKVILPLHSYHRDPSVWPRPLEFLPERFLPGQKDLAPADPEMFLVFGAGTRKCVGYRFALLELRMAVARVVQKFELRVGPGCPEPKMHTNVIYTIDRVIVNVTKRAGVTPA